MSRAGIFGWSYPPGCSGPPEQDYAAVETIAERTYSAGFEHKCENCSQPIVKGEIHTYLVLKDEDGKFFTARQHQICPYEEEQIKVWGDGSTAV